MTFKVIIRTDVIYKDNTSPLCLLFFHDGRKNRSVWVCQYPVNPRKTSVLRLNRAKRTMECLKKQKPIVKLLCFE